MLIQIFFNSEGFLGGWGIKNKTSKPRKISAKDISKAKNNNSGIVVDIPSCDLKIFHQAVDCRDFIEVLPTNSKLYDVCFGNLKLKFNDTQRLNDVKRTLDAHRFNKNKSDLENSIFE